MNELPEGWIVVPLQLICDQITDGSHYSPRTTNSGYAYITVKDDLSDS